MNPPAGWHPDPYDPAVDRYWDGAQWSGHTRARDTDPATEVLGTAGFGAATESAGVVGGDPATQMIDPGNGAGSPADQQGTKKPKWPWIVGGVVAAFIGIGAIGAATEKDEAESTPPATTTTSSVAPSTTTTKPTTTTSATVPVGPLVPQSTAAPLPTTTPPAVTTTFVPEPTTRSLEYSCSDAAWRESMGAEGDELCGAPWKPRSQPTQPAPAYTPPPAPQPAYTLPAPQQGSGTVHPGAYCSSPGATGVTTKGTPMVCVGEGGGKGRWKSAG